MPGSGVTQGATAPGSLASGDASLCRPVPPPPRLRRDKARASYTRDIAGGGVIGGLPAGLAKTHGLWFAGHVAGLGPLSDGDFAGLIDGLVASSEGHTAGLFDGLVTTLCRLSDGAFDGLVAGLTRSFFGVSRHEIFCRQRAFTSATNFVANDPM